MDLERTRRLPLQGTCNTRDLGGWNASHGNTKWGAFLRSDAPDALTQKDIEALLAYGLTDSIDLRSAKEAAEKPSVLAKTAGVQAHTVPMLDNIMSATDTEEMPKTLGELYISMIDEGAEDFAKVFRIFANAKGGVLFHCAVGKDRTGMVAMLLMKLAGVSDADILADYAISEIYLRKLLAEPMRQMEEMGMDPALLGSRVENMQLALDHLQNTRGSAENLLLAGGLTTQELEAVRKKLLV